MTAPAENAAEETQTPSGGLAAQATPVTPDGAPANGQAGESTEPAEGSAEEAPKPKRGRPKGGARKTRSVELILTISGGADGEWQADLRHGTERLVQGMIIPAAAVSRAAKELHPEISGGIETVLDETRKQHRERLEQLEAEMSKVKQALAELEDEEDEADSA